MEAGQGDPNAAMQIQALQSQVTQLTGLLQAMNADRSVETQKLTIDAFKAETDRLKAVQGAAPPEALQALVVKTVGDALATALPPR